MVDIAERPGSFADTHDTGTVDKVPTEGCPFGKGCPDPTRSPFKPCKSGLTAHAQWFDQLGGGGYPSVEMLHPGTAEVGVHLPADIDALRSTDTTCRGQPESIANIGLDAFSVPMKFNDATPPRIDAGKLGEYNALLAPKVKFIAVPAKGSGGARFEIVSKKHFDTNWHWTAQVSRHQIGNDFSDSLTAGSELRIVAA